MAKSLEISAIEEFFLGEMVDVNDLKYSGTPKQAERFKDKYGCDPCDACGPDACADCKACLEGDDDNVPGPIHINPFRVFRKRIYLA